MGENVGIDTKMDRLVPVEKFRDPEIRTVRQEKSRKRKAGKRQHGLDIDADPGEEASSVESEEPPSGKILDIVI